jgi:hypothetical protein
MKLRLKIFLFVLGAAVACLAGASSKGFIFHRGL